MKVVILAGGYGTRLSEYTETIPKPMVEVGGLPIIHHIMNRYAAFGFNDFVLALGYKADVLKDYFRSIPDLSEDDKDIHGSNDTLLVGKEAIDWRVRLADTGEGTFTGGRVGRLAQYLKDETFMLTYGDGLCDIPLDKLLEFHRSHGKLATISAVRPVARFGELKLHGEQVVSFQEKPQVTSSWINGGFFICEPKVIDLIQDDLTVWEKEPLETLSHENELMAFKHEGFWQCMDTKRDRDFLEELWVTGTPPWVA